MGARGRARPRQAACTSVQALSNSFTKSPISWSCSPLAMTSGGG